MNKDQIKTSVRYLIAIFGSLIAGWFAKSGAASSEDILSVLNSETVIALISAAVAAIWGVASRTTKKTIANAARLLEVKEIVVDNEKLAGQIRSVAPADTVIKSI